jgi:hypothetical protein
VFQMLPTESTLGVANFWEARRRAVRKSSNGFWLTGSAGLEHVLVKRRQLYVKFWAP